MVRLLGYETGSAAGPRVFLVQGILAYVLPIVTMMLLVSSALLVGRGVPLISGSQPVLTCGLAMIVLATLLFPKFAGSRSFPQFAISTWPGLLMTPALMVQSAWFFLVGLFGEGWKIRRSRGAELTIDHVTSLIRLFAPVSLLGGILWLFLGQSAEPWSDGMLAATSLLLFGSPLTAMLLSKAPSQDRWPRTQGDSELITGAEIRRS